MKAKPTCRFSGIILALVFGAGLFTAALGSPASGTRFFRIAGPVVTTITEFRSDGTVVWTNTPTNTTFTVQTAISLGGESSWMDYVQIPATNGISTNRVIDFNPPAGMALIPTGSFVMGDNLDGSGSALPLHTVYISAFYMDRYEVTKALWDEVYQWAITNGYSFDDANSGQGKAANHPVHSMTWYDTMKWCNARSEKEGLVPAYYTSAGQTAVYRSGQVNVQNDWVKWQTGYRLPTEAEWEKAARGGISGLRFPWGNTISQSQANYKSYAIGGVPHYAYDLETTLDHHPAFATGDLPYTSPVGYFTPNGYGLYDLAGNVWEWSWDWYSYSYYSSSPSSDPPGPTAGSYRVIRGGSWGYYAIDCRTTDRDLMSPADRYFFIGFRCARTAGQ